MSNQPKKSIHLSAPEAYDLWSQNYDSFDNPMLAMVDRAFKLHTLEVKGKNAIELGCGTGRNYERIHLAGAASYRGFDQSEGMLEKAKLKYPLAKFDIADIEKRLPLEDSSIDFVLVTLVFEHLANLLPTLKEVIRVLVPGGKIRILEIHSDISRRGTKAHFQHEEYEVDFPCYVHDTDQWKHSLTAAGFADFKIQDLQPDQAAIASCAKLKKHEGHAVLFDIEATKPI